mmetsp:Transcript_25722/g.50684  ORF Transcript_25722/g.50684 Transcript_25722/m.50684 type:complete len:223 (+) Transcript_25722:26-694(+)|eukprot:CAMPEP_0175159876 /NCGR_PEP_ID=MMETSP0087-20121206/23673_1 /TAXON_ID=136419 /ORGANISM="Unknown Unknown, Strain D1" /LENGTH=222 /DNA_ID=CAMNT_0016447989 /DNA_START=26 /DNA_END=694 /DNA_ORIENTATION=+
MAEQKQGFIRIGDMAPDFEADTQLGKMSWHKYIEGKWAILCSHPKDFTPVCTTEIGTMAKLSAEWAKRDTKVAVVSVDTAEEHKAWIQEINKSQGTDVQFPIFGDETKKIALAYGMLNQTDLDKDGLPLTVRSVFIIGPDKLVKLIITYPAATGRNFDEVIRVLDSLQMTVSHKVATPANWKQGEDCMLLPGVSDEDAAKFEGLKVISASCKLRQVPCPKKF